MTEPTRGQAPKNLEEIDLKLIISFPGCATTQFKDPKWMVEICCGVGKNAGLYSFVKVPTHNCEIFGLRAKSNPSERSSGRAVLTAPFNTAKVWSTVLGMLIWGN